MIFRIIALGLATYGLAETFVNESGPHQVFKKIRLFLEPRSEFFYDIASCQYCLSVYIAFALSVLKVGVKPKVILVWWGSVGVQRFLSRNS